MFLKLRSLLPAPADAAPTWGRMNALSEGPEVGSGRQASN